MTRDELRALIEQATHLYRYGDFNRCFDCCVRYLSISESLFEQDTEAQEWRVRIFDYSAAVSVSRFDFSSAIQFCTDGLHYANTCTDENLAATLHIRLGWVYQNIRRQDECRQELQKAKLLFDSTNNVHGSALVQMHTLFSREVHDPMEAKIIALEALHVFEQTGDEYWMTECQIFVCELYTHEIGELTMAVDYAKQALFLAEKNAFRRLIARAHSSYGSVFLELGEYQSALTHYQYALSLHEELDMKNNLAYLYANIGVAHNLLGNYEEAVRFLEMAAESNESRGALDLLAQNVSTIGDVYLRLGNYDAVIEYSTKALDYSLQTNSIRFASIATCNLGIVYGKRDYAGYNPVIAEKYFLQSLAMLDEIAAKNVVYPILAEVSNFYADQERWEEAYRYAMRAQHMKDHVRSEAARKQLQSFDEERRLMAERMQARVTESVLHRVLPPVIADRLIKGEKIADYFSQVSILFADIVGFTPIASRMPARAVLAFLNYVFGEFDRMVSACGCEKIKTIGDGYLAVAGAPDSCEDHAERIARLAIEMSKDIILPEEIRKTLPKAAKFSLRIGIHTGPCFAGIVGENRFVYDIYSDAVNIAARMESHGEAAKIHVSDEFCFHLQNRMDASGDDLGGVRFEERDEMEIKGKGLMRTYFLENTQQNYDR